MAKKNDGLFLLEVLIDKILFEKSPCFSDKDFRTCISIVCPGVEPLEICDDESGACIAKGKGPFIKSFNSGKSCLFSLSESEIATAMTKFPINVSVYKSLPCGCLPTKIIMGECTIDMTKEFVEARKTYLEDPTNVSYQALKDSFRIVGPDGSETGEIIMFLRISCFGKLIITRFQGPGSPPNVQASKGSAVVDRSCAPKKEFQSMQDPCACGAARGFASSGTTGTTCNVFGGSGVCPPAKDPYNSMPCEDPDDPCCCSGPKAQPKQQMACRNVDQYCLHVPKGSLRRLALQYDKEAGEELPSITSDYQVFSNRSDSSSTLTGSLKTHCFNKQNLTFFNDGWKSNVSIITLPSQNPINTGIFGMKNMPIYMTYSNNIYSHQTSSTQATASINKCLQVFNEWKTQRSSQVTSNSNFYSTCTVSTVPFFETKRSLSHNILNPEVYFFGRKKDDSKQMGMGSRPSQTKLQKSSQTTTSPIRSDTKRDNSKSSIKSNSNASLKKSSSTVATKPKPNLPAKTSKGAATASGTSKSVTIKDEKFQKPCPAMGTTKGDMMVTVSHIKIGPKETCPIHGTEPCQGPKCKLASSDKEQGLVNVSTVSNPRRGVFELVIRKLTGAPLARNELMLEWTPPPIRSPPCNVPCPSPYYYPSPRPCVHSKCKLVICRPLPCKPRCSRKRPCGQSSCRSTPCKKCCKATCCGAPCRTCKPCPPVPCCSQSPCIPACTKTPCTAPCKSSPCIKPCPVGRKRTRKSRSQPKIKSRRKKISPCHNRSKACPVVRCRSVSAPCRLCCGIQQFCMPRKCSSVVQCKINKSSIDSSIKSCSSCCG